MTDGSGTIRPRLPSYKKEGNYGPPPPGVLNGGAPPSVGHPGSPEYRQANPDGPKDAPQASDSDSLIAAIAKVHRAVTAKIAWHEQELKKLRAALAPFGEISPQRQSDAPANETSAAAVSAILSHLEKMVPTTGEQS